MDCFIAQSIKWCDILGAQSESIFPKYISFYNNTQRKRFPSDLAPRLKILTTKQILQILPKLLEQVKPVNKSNNLLNEIR